MFDLAQGLRNLGHEVDIFALPYTLENKRKMNLGSLFNDGIKYHEGPLHVINADVVYSMYHPFSKLNFITRAPTIASFHSQIWFKRERGGYGYVPKIAGSLGDYLMRKELTGFAALQTHYDIQRRMIETIAPRHPPIYVIGHFLDTERFKPTGVKKDTFTVLFVGRPVWQKGFDLYSKLAVELAPLGMRFQFAGGVTEKSQIESLGLISDESRLAQLMSEAHVVVSPTRIELASGKSVLEALSCGTPVITTSRIDPPLTDCRCLVEVADYSMTKEAIIKIRQKWNDGTYDEFASCARRCVMKDLSKEPTIKRYERMLLEVANRQY